MKIELDLPLDEVIREKTVTHLNGLIKGEIRKYISDIARPYIDEKVRIEVANSIENPSTLKKLVCHSIRDYLKELSIERLVRDTVTEEIKRIFNEGRKNI